MSLPDDMLSGPSEPNKAACAGYPTSFPSDRLHCLHTDWWLTDLQLDAYVPSDVSQSGVGSPAPPSRHQPIASCDPALGINPVQTIGPEWTPSEFDSRIDRFRSLDPSKKIPHIPDNAGVPLLLSW